MIVIESSSTQSVGEEFAEARRNRNASIEARRALRVAHVRRCGRLLAIQGHGELYCPKCGMVVK